jgi:hypothetical protein
MIRETLLAHHPKSMVLRALTLPLVLLLGCAAPPRPEGRVAVRPCARYVTLDGETRFWLGRMPTARDREGFRRHVEAAAAAGERLLRIHLYHGLPRPEVPAGVLDEAWCREWDGIFEDAKARGLHVLPVLSGWAQWNDGSTGSHWHAWDRNPYNQANGGPAARPSDLYADTPCQRAFLDWLGRAVDRFQGYPNLFAWEVFTEVDLLSGASDAGVPAVVSFVEKAAAVVRRQDPRRRPVTVSLSGVRVWPELWASPAVDLVQIHPYPGKRCGSDLAQAIAEIAPAVRAFGKPVLLGEEGLDAGPPVDTMDARPRAFVGYRQAVWTALTSGLANGGMFWWISGYGKGERDGAFPDVCKAAASFAASLDVSRMQPLAVTGDSGMPASALGDAGTVIGYARDGACAAPDWPSRTLSGKRVTLETPWKGGGRVTYLDPITLKAVASERVSVQNASVTLSLPDFPEDLVFRIDAGD